jgi:hypothetical protein
MVSVTRLTRAARWATIASAALAVAAAYHRSFAGEYMPWVRSGSQLRFASRKSSLHKAAKMG